MKRHHSLTTPVSLTLSLSLLTSLVLAPAGFSREWTSTEGKKIEAELVEVKKKDGADVAVLKLPTGRVHEVPLARLSTDDQAFARAEKDKPKSASPGGLGVSPDATPSAIKTLLDGKLVAVNGKKAAKFEMKEAPEYFAFYFSASWCGPCKQFTPKLVEFYKGNEQAGKKFEVVLVSSDTDAESMEKYMTDDAMPWPAIAYRQIDRLKEVKKYSGKGIPCLVVVDRDGKVLSDSYVDGEYVGPQKVMKDLEDLIAKK